MLADDWTVSTDDIGVTVCEAYNHRSMLMSDCTYGRLGEIIVCRSDVMLRGVARAWTSQFVCNRN